MLRLFVNLCQHKVKIHPKATRTFLSDAYKCTELWNNRLNSPLLQKVRVEELYNIIDQRFSRHELVSAIDIDIFANAIDDESYLNELRDLLHKLRLTPETLNTLESTQYAVVKNFINGRKFSELIEILDDRLNYGIFLNEFTANMLLDELIKINDYSAAAKVASTLMLQESNFENNKITENLSLYSCLKYLGTLQPEVIEETVESPKSAVKKKKEEEVKVRVHFIRNPYFDDHFDLNDLNLLTGKTIATISSKYSDAFGLNCQLIGWLFYKKFDKVKAVSEIIKREKKLIKEFHKLIKDSLELSHFKRDTDALKISQEVLVDLEQTNCFEENNVNADGVLVDKINFSLESHQAENIQRQSQLFGEWETTRSSLLSEQLKRLEDFKAAEERKAKREELRLLDEKIWFFDNEEKFDLKINIKPVKQPKVVHKSQPGKQKKLHIDENYIPPEVQSRYS